jgi:TRAP-type mannitol/chloroaromatic compound transport system permease large subunit
MANTMNLSVGTLFASAVLPRLLPTGRHFIYFLVLGMIFCDLVLSMPLAQRQPIRARELVVRLSKVALPPLGLVIAVLGSMLRSLPSPSDSSVNRVTDYMAGGVRSISGSGKLRMDGTTEAVSVDPS